MHLGFNVSWSFDSVKFEDVLGSITKFRSQFLDVSRKPTGSVARNRNPSINEKFRLVGVYVDSLA
jgi:hypothetical protein